MQIMKELKAQWISKQFLRWKGIEATQKLAESQNTKVVVIGSGKDGLPIILDTTQRMLRDSEGWERPSLSAVFRRSLHFPLRGCDRHR